MPLTMLPVGKQAVINICRARDETLRFLEGLGLIPGETISIVSEIGGNLIVNVKGSRIALSKGIAQKLMVQA